MSELPFSQPHISRESLRVLGKVPSLTLVGAGGFGAAHLRVIQQMEAEGLGRLQSVIEPAIDRLPETKTDLKNRGIPCYPNWEAMLAGESVADAVILAVPIPLHFDYAIKAYRSGAYVYLEKPPVPLLEQLEELIKMEGRDRRTQVGFTFSYGNLMEEITSRLQDGILGDILSYRLAACWPRDASYYARASWAGKIRDRGLPVYDGPATNALAHRLQDLLSIESLVQGELTVPSTLRAELYRARPIESYDACCARGVFPSGADFSVALSHAASRKKELTLKIIGTKGIATILQSEASIQRDRTTERITANEDSIIVAYRNFLRMVAQGHQPKLGLIETWPYVATTNAMFRSSRTIHSLSSEYFQVTPNEAGYYQINGIEDLSEASFQTGKTFSELNAPWAIPGIPVTPEKLLSKLPIPARRIDLPATAA